MAAIRTSSSRSMSGKVLGYSPEPIRFMEHVFQVFQIETEGEKLTIATDALNLTPLPKAGGWIEGHTSPYMYLNHQGICYMDRYRAIPEPGAKPEFTDPLETGPVKRPAFLPGRSANPDSPAAPRG